MFGIGTPEFIFILFIGLIVLGPEKLPKMMRSVGKMLAQFRSMISDVEHFGDEDSGVRVDGRDEKEILTQRTQRETQRDMRTDDG